VLYEMLTGVPPFQADTPHAYLMLHSQQRPKALRDANPQVAASPELEALIFRALEKDRANRFATAREFAQALERIAPQLPDVGGAPPPLPATADVTDEATRVTPRTVLASEEPTRISDRELFAVPSMPDPEPVPAQPKRRAIWIAPVAAALLVAGGWIFIRGDKPPASSPDVVQAATIPIQTAPSPADATPRNSEALRGTRGTEQPSRLAINAFPWATVASIRNLDNGESVDLGDRAVTPTTVDVAPGRYELTLTNPHHPRAITRTITVANGQDAALTAHFTDPARAALPDFGATR
jgi:serine/threonine protein kinase